MRRALPAIAASAAALTWLLHAQGVVDAGVDSSPSTVDDLSAAATGSGAEAAPTSSDAARTTVDGPTVDTRYGPVQVEVVLAGSQVVEVRVLQSPSDARRSVSINERAVPLLNEQVLSAQSAQIDGVSGATYTTDAYEESLQAALDNADVHQ